MKDASLLVSYIIVNYNGLNDSLSLIDSLNKFTNCTYEIIIVDNGSRENESKIISERYPQVVSIRSEKNLGFAGGNNLGVDVARGKYLFFINNDTFIISDIVTGMIALLDEHPNIGGVSPKLKYPDDKDTLQFCGYTDLTPVTLRNRAIGFKCRDEKQFDDLHPTAFLHGAAMFIRREVIEKVGKMSEIFFLYYEEYDWSSQMLDKGYELYYYPYGCVFHKESQSVGAMSPLKVYYITRNRLLYGWRHRNGLVCAKMVAYNMLCVVPKNAMQYILTGNFKLLRPLFKGAIDFITLGDKMR